MAAGERQLGPSSGEETDQLEDPAVPSGDNPRKRHDRDDEDGLEGGSGNDRLKGGPDKDTFYGGAGNDRISARDGTREKVDCGKGRDRAKVDRRDRVKHCEKVLRR